MRRYLARFRCGSPYLTPWRSPTVWGRLTWAVASGAVQSWSIGDWLDAYESGLPPVVVGDGFPESAVPVPAACLARHRGTEKPPGTLAWRDWLALCATGEWPAGARAVPVPAAERTHVTMNRATGTGERGMLRTEHGDWPERMVLPLWADDSVGEDAVRALLAVLAAEGWGHGRSYGYGHIVLEGVEALAAPADAGHYVLLGHCHPTADLPEEGHWRWAGVPVLAHDPATRRAILPQRFVTMLGPGATFPSSGGVPAFAGEVVSTRLPGHDRYLHHGLAPAWPVYLKAA